MALKRSIKPRATTSIVRKQRTRTRADVPRPAEPKCEICAATMTLKTVIPAAHIFPELKTFQCVGCGLLRTVENESELTARLNVAA
jgi:hypothetical protein